MSIGINPALLWLIAGVVLFIFEIFSGTVAMLCLCIGCLFGAICAVCGFSPAVQVTVVTIVTLGTFILAGPSIKKYYARRASPRHTSNMDALIGREGVVTVPVTANHSDGGRVKIDGDNWQSFTTAANVPLPVGSHVIVQAYDSIVLKVKPISHDPA